MALEARDREILARFADVLSYPTAELVDQVRACERLCDRRDPEAASRLQAFRLWASTTDRGRLQEVYSGIFDLDPARSLYVGHYLFGESYKRSAFMLRLKERYRAHGFEHDGGTELPDHLVVVLRFLSLCPDEELIRVIVEEGVQPALDAMLGEEPETPMPQLTGAGAPLPAEPDGESVRSSESRREAEHPYLDVLRALRRVLQSEFGTATAAVAGADEGRDEGGGVYA